MCGRLTQRLTWREVYALLSLGGPSGDTFVRVLYTWLSGEDVRLVPAPADWLTMHWVGLRVNHPRNDDPECVVALGAA